MFRPDKTIKNSETLVDLPILKLRRNQISPILIKKYNPKDYPQYDNYKAINVDKVKDIPYDYNDVMGVPITILGLQVFRWIYSFVGSYEQWNEVWDYSGFMII